MKLTAKQARFVAEYLIDLNATQAAIRAGYTAKNADVTGPRLLGNVGVSRAIAVGKAKQLDSAELSATRVLEELRRLAFSNVQDLFDEAGNLRPIHTLTREQASCIASLEVIKKNAEAGDGHIDVVHKLKSWDKTRTLEMLARHYQLLTDTVKITTDDANIARLLGGRQRASQRSLPPVSE